MPDWCATDVGTWKLKLTNVKGEVFQEELSLIHISEPTRLGDVYKRQFQNR